jgi:hypothetical protein
LSVGDGKIVIYPAASQFYFGYRLWLPLSAFEVNFRHGEKGRGSFGPMPTVPGAGASKAVRTVADTGDSFLPTLTSLIRKVGPEQDYIKTLA